MAVGNLLLGMGRKKIGDVVFYRSNGKQCARARNRNPKNPKTDKQKVQRSIAANIQRLYSTGYDIFNHSFQGQIVGRGNQSSFVSRNMKILRSLVVDDLNTQALASDARGRVGLPGFTVPVPFAGMQVSDGSLTQNAFILDDDGTVKKYTLVYDDEHSDTQTVADVCADLNLKAGDIFTFVAFCVKASEDYLAKVYELLTHYDELFPCEFRYVQLMVKESALTSTATMDEATIGDMFDVSGLGILATDTIGSNIDVRKVFGSNYAVGDILLAACIKSREDEGVRSTSFLSLLTTSKEYGIASNYIYDGWDTSRSLDGSDLILEGENF